MDSEYRVLKEAHYIFPEHLAFLDTKSIQVLPQIDSVGIKHDNEGVELIEIGIEKHIIGLQWS